MSVLLCYLKNRNNPNLSSTEIRFGLSCLGTPEGTRTPNPRNRNPMLYPLSHWRICFQLSYYSRKIPLCKEAGGKIFCADRFATAEHFILPIESVGLRNAQKQGAGEGLIHHISTKNRNPAYRIDFHAEKSIIIAYLFTPRNIQRGNLS